MIESMGSPPVPATPSNGLFGLKPPYGRLHIERSGFLYVGVIPLDATTQRNSAVVCVALTENEFSVHTKKRSLSVGATLAAPGYLQVNGGTSPLAFLDVCPTDSRFRALARAAATTQVLPRLHFAPIFEALEAFKSGQMYRTEVGPLYDRFVDLALQLVPAVPPLDPRVREIMRLLREEPRMSVAELAKAVDISVDWLRHLFVTEVGIPLRKYEMTLRLQTAAAYMQRGVSLTDVAASAGFADLAHFSKFWKLHYGFAPKRIFIGKEVAIDDIPWQSLEATRPSAETEAGPAR